MYVFAEDSIDSKIQAKLMRNDEWSQKSTFNHKI